MSRPRHPVLGRVRVTMDCRPTRASLTHLPPFLSLPETPPPPPAPRLQFKFRLDQTANGAIAVQDGYSAQTRIRLATPGGPVESACDVTGVVDVDNNSHGLDITCAWPGYSYVEPCVAQSSVGWVCGVWRGWAWAIGSLITEAPVLACLILRHSCAGARRAVVPSSPTLLFLSYTPLDRLFPLPAGPSTPLRRATRSTRAASTPRPTLVPPPPPPPPPRFS